MSSLILSPKYKSFIQTRAKAEFLEGTTMAGKTTVGAYKFILKVAASPKKLHIIASKDIGTAEKNIINKDLGIADIFGNLIEYNGNGTKDNKIAHITLHTSSGDKMIYVMGYGDRAQWKKALGGQYGCLFVDEINTADIDFVREAAMRCDYLMGTLNPDDPGLPVYREFINCARPLSEWREDVPQSILEDLNEEPKPGWVHWFFSFSHNLGLNQDELDRVLQNTPKGTKIYKNKVLGERGRATGLVFSNFMRSKHIKTAAWADQFLTNKRGEEHFVQFTAGLDTAYSQKSEDTISMTFEGITSGRKLIVLDERVYNNRDLAEPLAASDTVLRYIEFLERNRKRWGFARNTFIDNADQATIMEFAKYKRNHGSIHEFNPAWKSKMHIIDRINAQLGWLATGHYFVLKNCTNTIDELESYSWLEDKDNTPEDRHDHCINSTQYGWIPFFMMIGDNNGINNSDFGKH